ncbi:MAG: glycosyltransferase family 2 protein [Terriglobia bacterium]
MTVTPNPNQERPPRVLISILNWNGWKDILECLESIRKLNYSNYLVSVVDNGSKDDSAERIKAWAEGNLGAAHGFAEYRRETALQGGAAHTEQALDHAPSAARLVLIRNEENLGFTGGHNVGIRYALQRPEPADYVFLLNPDTELDRECLRVLVSVAQAADAGVVGAVITDHTGKVQFAGSGPAFQHFFRMLTAQPVPHGQGDFWDSPIVHGGAMFIASQALRSVHKRRGMYLNDGLFIYSDELDFCTWAHREGYRIVVARKAIVCHRIEVRHQPRGTTTANFFYYFPRNSVILANTLLPLGKRLLFHLLFLPLSARRIAKRLLAGDRPVARIMMSAVWDGYRGVTGKWKDHDSHGLKDGGG